MRAFRPSRKDWRSSPTRARIQGMRSAAPLAAALAVGCASPPPAASPPPRQRPAPVDASQAARPVAQRDQGPPRELLDRLAQRGVHRDRPNARVLYSWTTATQLTDLRRDKRLLVRSESPTQGRSAFDGALDQVIARTGSGAAQAMQKSPLDRRRFAFPNAFATARGIHGESYGDVLLEVRLRSDAWLAVVQDGSLLQYVDLDGKVLSPFDVEQNLGRVAGALHTGPDFRELVLLNEAAVERWSVCTPEIARAVREEMTLLRAIAEHLPEGLGPLGKDETRNRDLAIGRVWLEAPTGSAELGRLLLGALASLDPAYEGTSSAWAKLARSVERAIACPGEPLVVEPKLAYPKVTLPAPKLPTWRPPRRPRGTFM